MNKSAPIAQRGQIVSVQRCDRWSIHHRLQELDIPSACPADGTLRVKVDHALALVLVRSTLRQFLTSRQEQADWLEQCWQSRERCSANS
ncbi:MAG: Asr1405/Asl0597 family protein [Cyanobacteria bacterium P01_A01_bin.135]